MDLLKFITCGSVDDGKSTLMGHMLYDAKMIFADQENALKLESNMRHHKGNPEKTIDYSLLLDGLSAEREQGITIDVAYRYFHTEKRSFILADTPGHEEYTRNMAVGASFAQLAVILVDANKGISPQTQRHLRICAMMGIQHLVFAMNKMDLVDYKQDVFEAISKDINSLLRDIPCDSLTIIPVSATEGDNISQTSPLMSWYTGKALLPYLEELPLSPTEISTQFLMAVQRVCRPSLGFRGFQGQVTQGKIQIGEELTVLPRGEKARVSQLFHTDQRVTEITTGQAVTLTLDREVDCSRGSVLSQSDDILLSALFRCELLWMDELDLVVGRNHLLKLGTKTISATILQIHHGIDIQTGQALPFTQGKKNDIIHCDISLSEKIPLSPFSTCPELGRFLLIHPVTHGTSACGTVSHHIHRRELLTCHETEITPEIRAAQKQQSPKTYWFTGLSGSGKSTLANALEKQLHAQGKHTMLLDGDHVRMGLNSNLGFTEKDRVENIRRLAEVAKLMNQAGLLVLVSAISPFACDRQQAKEIIGEAFFEIYVDTPLEICEQRDTKGLYAKARAGIIPHFTGISSPYDVPTHADCIIRTHGVTVEDCVTQILQREKK